ncbi:MAG: hypothetical protein V2A75_08050 [Pseudomonadota bacterium]
MDWQWIANGAFVILGIVGTALYNSLKNNMDNSFKSVNESIHEIELDASKLTEKVQAVELLVAGNYVMKSEFEAKMDAMLKKLDKIFDKLDGKADK